MEEIGVGSGAVVDDEGRKVGSDPRYAEIHAARLGESSNRLEASEAMRWSSDCARGSGGRSGSSDGDVVRVGAEIAAVAAGVAAGTFPCGGEEVGFTGTGLGGRDGDEAVIPSLAGDGRCDCIILTAAAVVNNRTASRGSSCLTRFRDPHSGLLGRNIYGHKSPSKSAIKSLAYQLDASPAPICWRETVTGSLRRLHFPRKQHMAGGSSSPASPPQAAAAASVEEMEEYQNWKKNTPVLYDLVISHPLEWPSLTVQWLPSESPTRSHRLVVGTHTSDEAPNHLILLDATLPLPPRLAAAAAASGGAVPAPSVSVSRAAPHRGEVNRARCMPQRPYTVATKTCVDEVHVYHLGDGCSSGKSGADVVLKGHDAEGYGLAWSPMKEGWLLSGSYDKKVCLWDLAAASGAPVLDAQQVFEVMLH